MGISQNRWSIMENPIKMDDLGLPLVSDHSSIGSVFGDGHLLNQPGERGTIQVQRAPASLIPSCKICPSGACHVKKDPSDPSWGTF